MKDNNSPNPSSLKKITALISLTNNNYLNFVEKKKLPKIFKKK